MSFKNIDKLCKLTRINLNKEEKEKFSKEINEVILMFDELNDANTDGIKPSFHIFDIKDRCREDKSKEFKDRNLLWKNIKYSKDNYIIGPKVFE